MIITSQYFHSDMNQEQTVHNSLQPVRNICYVIRQVLYMLTLTCFSRPPVQLNTILKFRTHVCQQTQMTEISLSEHFCWRDCFFNVLPACLSPFDERHQAKHANQSLTFCRGPKQSLFPEAKKTTRVCSETFTSAILSAHL